MLDHTSFSALRLNRIFPPELLESYSFYIEVDPEGDFDMEYLGGQWHEELIDGVQFFFPASNGRQLGVVELWGSGCVLSAAVRDRPESNSASLVPAWAANVNRVLEVLELPIRMGSDEAAVSALAQGKILRSSYSDEWYTMYPAVKGTIAVLSFACRAPAIYHMSAVLHATEGLLKLEVRRPDVVRSNDSECAYDACTKGMYDEGPE